MRLGAWTARLKAGSFAHQAYGSLEISERHRHRYEFNREYEETLVANGLQLTGTTPDSTYVEIVEIRDHPWFLGCQFHPEFKSRPLEPHPLFTAFVAAAYEFRTKRLNRCRKRAGDDPFRDQCRGEQAEGQGRGRAGFSRSKLRRSARQPDCRGADRASRPMKMDDAQSTGRPWPSAMLLRSGMRHGTSSDSPNIPLT